MSSVGAARNKRSCGMEVDRISNLPLDLTHKILECLPLHEVARTSVLSQQWRFKWASMPQLILGKSFCKSIQERRNDPEYISLIYSNAVNNIILSRVGPISKFVLHVPLWFRGETYMWIRYVCANGVNEFSLEYDQKKVPTSLFTCSGLTHLTLIECKLLSLPPTFKGFPHLIYLKLSICLELERCNEAKVFEILISKCPQLESLHLLINVSLNFTIYAPKVTNLFVEGFLYRLYLEETTAIKTLDLDIYLDSGGNWIFNCFANVENLVLEEYFWEDFDYSRKFQSKMGQLRTLKLVEIPLHDQSHISFLLCLFASSPLLEQLYIKVSESEVDVDIEDHSIQIECPYIHQCLRKVQLRGISGLTFDLQLLKHILAHSPVLEEMTIELSTYMGGAEEKFKFAIEAMRYRRASPNAEIIINAK